MFKLFGPDASFSRELTNLLTLAFEKKNECASRSSGMFVIQSASSPKGAVVDQATELSIRTDSSTVKHSRERDNFYCIVGNVVIAAQVS